MTTKEELTKGICTEMEGKMEGMWSLSTSSLHNPNCLKNREIPHSICSKCYAHSLLLLRSALDNKVRHNEDLLTKEILKDEDIPDIATPKYFRFEAFGDIYNEVHLQNYVLIAKHNPTVQFALFTKNYRVILNYFGDNRHRCPNNMNIVLSSIMINKPMDERLYSAILPKGHVKIFTVYNYEYLKHHPEVEINCGSRSCVTCGKCYYHDETVCVNEILKSDQDRTLSMMTFRDDGKRETFLATLFTKLSGKY